MSDKITRCWVVDCKTPNCGVMVLAVIGPPEPYRFPMFLGCDEFEVACDGCHATHKYHEMEVRWENIANLREDYKPSQSFLRACQQAQHTDSDRSE